MGRKRVKESKREVEQEKEKKIDYSEDPVARNRISVLSVINGALERVSISDVRLGAREFVNMVKTCLLDCGGDTGLHIG
jgi:hypothetical protein